MKSFTTKLLTLTEQPYDNYNAILPRIKDALLNFDMVGEQRVETFEDVLEDQLPLTTARRAYRAAICRALGEETGYSHEHRPDSGAKTKKVN